MYLYNLPKVEHFCSSIGEFSSVVDATAFPCRTLMAKNVDHLKVRSQNDGYRWKDWVATTTFSTK